MRSNRTTNPPTSGRASTSRSTRTGRRPRRPPERPNALKRKSRRSCVKLWIELRTGVIRNKKQITHVLSIVFTIVLGSSRDSVRFERAPSWPVSQRRVGDNEDHHHCGSIRSSGGPPRRG